MADKRNIWTVPLDDDTWGNRREGASTVSKKFDTQAIKAGRATAQNERLEHFIQNKQGQIRERNSYGGDSPRRKG